MMGGSPPWSLEVHEQCASTNDLARALPAWHAVMAREQWAGRGRFGRAWQSGRGGLWLSAVVPAPMASAASRLVPLAAGSAVLQTLASAGAADLWLRWPNDVMTVRGKCAGILVDRFHPDRCVVGIGVNVLNRPWLGDAALAGQSTRLADLVDQCPSVEQLAEDVLRFLARAIRWLEAGRTDDLVTEIQCMWKTPSRVKVSLQGTEQEYEFLGVDALGRVLLQREGQTVQAFTPEDITLLREL